MNLRTGRFLLALALLAPAAPGAAVEWTGKGPLELPSLPAAVMPAAPATAASAGAQLPGSAPAAPAAGAQLAAGASASSAEASPAQAGPEAAASLGRAFDGAGERPSLLPAFEPEAAPAALPQAEAEQAAPEAPDRPSRLGERPSLSFPQSVKNALIAVDPAKAIYGAAKAIRETPKRKGERKNGSEKYWDAFKRGVALDVFVGNESVYGRPAKITYAATKPIGRMSKEDFKGLVPAFQLQLRVAQLRQKLVERLEEGRAFWHRSDAPISLKTRVRVVKFQSYIDLYKETHGKKAVPEPEPAVERAPLLVKAEGKLANLTRFPPRLVFLDVDSLEAPLTAQQLADMAELQRTGVYFVAFSRRPYDAPGGMRDVLVRNMSGSQLTAQMPNRFLAVTDDGAVISKLRKDGAVAPVDALRYSFADLEVLRDAAQKAFERVAFKAGEIVERKQGPIFVESQRFNPFRRERLQTPQDPRVRYELIFPAGSEERLAKWRDAFERRLSEQGIPAVGRVARLDGGRLSYTVQKTDLPGALERVYEQLGEEFGMYATPTKSDVVVLSDDPVLRRVNPRLDVAAATPLTGTARFENVLGLILGEARKGGKKGSASRMIQFSGYRERYMSDFIIAQDAAEQNINFFSGHVVHAANDWLVSRLQHGAIPTREEYEAHLRSRWDRGIRETKPVGIPKGTRMERLLNASVTRALNMYDLVVAAHKRGEVIVGTEIPNFMVIEKYERGVDGKLKQRYIVHTIFDFVAIRPTRVDAQGRKHGILVTYDFKTGPAKSVQKLEKDDQVLTYSLFNHERWVGRPFYIPYLSGDDYYMIDDDAVVMIYNLTQSPTIDPYAREKQRRRIPRIFDAIARTEAKLMGVTGGGKPLAPKAKRKPKSRKK